MENKEQLQKLIAFISSVAKQQGNEWFVEELAETLQASSVGNHKIDEIYEFCIEEISKKQAKGFYKDFPIKEIVPQLELDFMRMEAFKRKDNFEDFALAIYQQVENITNQIVSDNNFRFVYHKLLNYPAYLKYNTSKMIYEWTSEGNETVADFVFHFYKKNKVVFDEKVKKDVSKLDATDKIRAVIYFICFKGKIKKTDKNNFNEMSYLIYSIYQYRNKNHRGGTVLEYQRKIFDKIEPKKDQYYMKFLKAYTAFVEGVENGFPINQELVEYCKTLDDKGAELGNVK